MVIIVLGIVAAIAIPRMGGVSEDSKISATKSEMVILKKAIVGDPAITAGGRYIDVGFQGDIGQPPTSLSDLGRKPDSLPLYNRLTRTGWNGPYVDTSGEEYLKDAWGVDYIYDMASRTITSIGGSEAIVISF